MPYTDGNDWFDITLSSTNITIKASATVTVVFYEDLSLFLGLKFSLTCGFQLDFCAGGIIESYGGIQSRTGRQCVRTFQNGYNLRTMCTENHRRRVEAKTALITNALDATENMVQTTRALVTRQELDVTLTEVKNRQTEVIAQELQLDALQTETFNRASELAEQWVETIGALNIIVDSSNLTVAQLGETYAQDLRMVGTRVVMNQTDQRAAPLVIIG